MRKVEVCFSPSLFKKDPGKDYTIVIIDVLRASSAICAAFDAGAVSVIPLRSLREARVLKASGYLVSAEREGVKPYFADFGNSPFGFDAKVLYGRQLAYTTTNGTRALLLAGNAGEVLVGAFNNLPAITTELLQTEKNVILLCAGWKNAFSLEDTLCAGAMADRLVSSGDFDYNTDTVSASLTLWNNYKHNLLQAVTNSDHGIRLQKLGLQAEIDFCLKTGISSALPFWNGLVLINKNKLQ